MKNMDKKKVISMIRKGNNNFLHRTKDGIVPRTLETDGNEIWFCITNEIQKLGKTFLYKCYLSSTENILPVEDAAEEKTSVA